MKFRHMKGRRILLLSVAATAVIFFILNFVFPLRVDIKYSQIITAWDGTILHAFLSKDQKWRMMTTSKEISPRLEKAILFKEDHWFYYHPGVNPVAMCRALFNNLFHMKR